jgi:hypothetical protein
MQLHLVHPGIDIDKLKAGHIETFHLCYTSLYEPLQACAAEWLFDKSYAVTCMQLAFIKCWLKRSRLSSVDYLDAFLRVTVKNTCKAFNNNASTQESLPVLNRILSNEIRYGRSRSALHAHLQLLPAGTLESIDPLFERLFFKKETITEIASAYDMPSASVQFKIDLTCQALHLIISNERIG